MSDESKEVHLVCGNGHEIDAAHIEAFKAACAAPSPEAGGEPETAKIENFVYLPNRMENAASHEIPAKHGYGDARKAVFEYFDTLVRENAALRVQLREVEQERDALKRKINRTIP